jgi:type II secretory pathway pseudopilin PulG
MGRTPRCHRVRTAARGFTLMEATLAVVIVAFGFLATMELFASCTAENQRSQQMTTAQMLTTSIQELTTGLAFKDPYYATGGIAIEPGETLARFNDVDDFDGFVSSPPIDATRAPIPELSQYTQKVEVMAIDPNRPGANYDTKAPQIQKTVYTGAVRVRVIIEYRRSPTDPPVEVLRSSWVRLDD